MFSFQNMPLRHLIDLNIRKAPKNQWHITINLRVHKF